MKRAFLHVNSDIKWRYSTNIVTEKDVPGKFDNVMKLQINCVLLYGL